MELIFWLSALLVGYIYVGYPLVVTLLARACQRSPNKSDFKPSVTVLISAYNESGHIEATVRNKFNQNYPLDKLSVIVISDASDDGTDEKVTKLAEEYPGQLTLLRQEERGGKTAALNVAMQKVESEVVIFSDANSIYHENAIANLVKNFADKDVGYVTGHMVYTNSDGSISGDGTSAYMRYENYLRKQESLTGSIVGVDGGIDAIRRKDWQPMNADQLPDFVQPLKIVELGKRVVYEPTAILYEEDLKTPADEYKMRVRVCLRAFWALKDMSTLLNVARFPLFGFQLWSHKLLRYLAFIPLVLLLVSNVILLSSGFYGLVFIGQLVFYFFALQGWRKNDKEISIWEKIPHYFALINIASAHAFWKFLNGQKQVIWNPRLGQ